MKRMKWMLLVVILSLSFILSVSASPTTYGEASGSQQGSSHYDTCEDGWSQITTNVFTGSEYDHENKGCCPSGDYCLGKLAPTSKSVMTNCNHENPYCSDYYCYSTGSIIYENKKGYCAPTYEYGDETYSNVFVNCNLDIKGLTSADGKFYCNGNIWKNCENGKNPLVSEILYPDGKASVYDKSVHCCLPSDSCVYGDKCLEEQEVIFDSNICKNGDIIRCTDDYSGETMFNDKFVCSGSKWEQCMVDGTVKEGLLCLDETWQIQEECTDATKEQLQANGKYICNGNTWKECKSGVTTEVNEYICGDEGKWIICGESEDSCYEPICWTDSDCQDAVCDEDTGDVVVWSYNFPNEVNAYNQNQVPGGRGCCQENSCAVVGGGCFSYNIVHPASKDYLCIENNNWLVCNSQTPELIGTKSLSGDFYCTGTEWIPIETNCTDGLADDGYPELTDCADPTCDGEIGAVYGQDGCLLESGCVCQYEEELICDDGFDNDQVQERYKSIPKNPIICQVDDQPCEVLPDHFCGPDSFCTSEGQMNELCHNGIDDDFDDELDCIDEECSKDLFCTGTIQAPQDEEFKDCEDPMCVFTEATGPNKAQCCLTTADCSLGAVCGEDNECHETICDKAVDNDKDNLTQCEDPDCNLKQCDDMMICSGNVCTGIKGPGQAALQEKIFVQIFSYKQLLEELNKCQLKTGTGVCNTICGTQKCIFADGGRNSCSEEGSTKCTCC